VHVGGGVGPDGARFGRFVTKIPVRRLPSALEQLIFLYRDEHRAGERPDDFFDRVSLERVKAALGDLDELAAKDAIPDDFFDLDERGENVELNIIRGTPEQHMC
jgi:hypothetical protein